VLPVAVLAFLPPLKDGRAATLSAASVYVPVQEDLGLRVTPSPQGGFDLVWRPRSGTTAKTFSVVYRSPAEFRIPKGSPEDFPLVREGLLCESRHGGAAKCTIEMDQVATTREARWYDNPDAGRWTYRIGVAANWVDDEQLGDALIVSKPFTVTAP
jgi:hypothetical protein